MTAISADGKTIDNSKYGNAHEILFIENLGQWSLRENTFDKKELLLNYIFALKKRTLGFSGEPLSQANRELLRQTARELLDQAGG